MIKTLSSAQMRACDRYTIDTLGVPSLTLMERAGQAIAAETQKVFSALGVNEALVVCGGGNNGGDGFVAARLLQEAGADVQILCLAEKFSPDCAAVKEKFKGEILQRMPRRRYPVILDCIFGTGLSRPVEGTELSLIRFINAAGAFVISADIPSGLNGDNGLVTGECVRADLTVKGTYGKVSIIAGSRAYSGAALLAASAALRGGAGYVELCVPSGLFSVYAGKLPEVILTSFSGEDAFSYCEEDLEKVLSGQCVVAGMGMGASFETYKMVKYLLERYTGRLVLDADALNALARYGTDILKEKKCAVLLTPHIKEFSRLSGLSVKEISERGARAPQEFAAACGVSVLLKSAVSVLCGEEKIFFNVRGSACQAKGGSGDVLSGVIGSLAAQGRSVTDAALAGSYLCGVAGELCEQELGQYSVTAGDVIAHIPAALRHILDNGREN